MRRRKTPSSRSGETGDLPTERTDYRVRLEGRLERAIAKRIGDDSHRWVDITFPYRGE